MVVIGGGVIGTSIAYHLGHLGWTRHRARRARPADLGHDWHAAGLMVTFGSTSRDLDRAAQVHPRPVRPPRGRDRAGDRLQAGRLHRARRRRGSARGVPAGGRVQPLLRRRCRRRSRRREVAELFPLARTDDVLAGLLRRRRRPGQPGRRHDVAGQGRAPDRASTIAQGVTVHDVVVRDGAVHRRRHRPRHDRVRVRRQRRRHVGPPARRRGRA